MNAPHLPSLSHRRRSASTCAGPRARSSAGPRSSSPSNRRSAADLRGSRAWCSNASPGSARRACCSPPARSPAERLDRGGGHEEIRGPFLVARSILPAPGLRDSADDGALERAVAAISGHDEAGLQALTPDRQMLRLRPRSRRAAGRCGDAPDRAADRRSAVGRRGRRAAAPLPRQDRSGAACDGRPEPLRRRRKLHHPRADRLRLASGAARQSGRRGSDERRRRGHPRSGTRLRHPGDRAGGPRGAPALAAARSRRGDAQTRRADVHVHGHRPVHQPRRGAGR